MTTYNAFCDDFVVSMDIQTSLELPDQRETIVQFFEACQKQFPDMGSFYRRETGEFVFESDREKDSYRWIELDEKRLTSAFLNPPDVNAAMDQHRWILDRCKYFLGISHIDIGTLDLVYGFAMDFTGNRDSLVAKALLGDSPLGCLSEDGGFDVINFEPNMIVSLSENCCTQARVSLETNGGSHQVSTGNFGDHPIGVYLAVRKYPNPSEVFDMQKAFESQVLEVNDLAEKYVLPRIVRPIATAIAAEM